MTILSPIVLCENISKTVNWSEYPSSATYFPYFVYVQQSGSHGSSLILYLMQDAGRDLKPNSDRITVKKLQPCD
jgi:hypothetical protein